ncbi:MAG: ATP synthase F1 subunit gamma [Candidatus Aminicenantes bacterium]|jgi:F-type H+-transporting ATPase subunit gamma
MAQNLIDLRRRIRAVKDTQKTTQAMKTVSAVKMRRSVNELNRIRPILEKIESLIKHVAQASAKEIKSHPFLKERETGDTIIVAISADKGLCGAFNSHLIEKVENHYQERLDQEGDNLSLVTVGNKAFKHFKKNDYPIKKNYQSVITRLKYHHALDLSQYLQEIFLNPDEEIKRIEFVFTRYISAAKHETAVRQLFPIPFTWEEEEESHSNKEDIEYIFEPSAQEIFKALLPRYINTLVYQALLQSTASEHAARMAAMEAATQNADEMIRELTLTLNKLRQASITGELLEIITATEALKNL